MTTHPPWWLLLPNNSTRGHSHPHLPLPTRGNWGQWDACSVSLMTGPLPNPHSVLTATWPQWLDGGPFPPPHPHFPLPTRRNWGWWDIAYVLLTTGPLPTPHSVSMATQPQQLNGGPFPPPCPCISFVSMLLTTVLLMYIYTACWLNNYEAVQTTYINWTTSGHRFKPLWGQKTDSGLERGCTLSGSIYGHFPLWKTLWKLMELFTVAVLFCAVRDGGQTWVGSVFGVSSLDSLAP